MNPVTGLSLGRIVIGAASVANPAFAAKAFGLDVVANPQTTFVMRLFGYPIAPIVVGLILGPLAEQQLRRALAISQGDWTVLVSSPVSAGLMTVAVLAFVVPMILRIRGRGKVLSQLAADED